MSECIVRMKMPESCDACPCLDDYGDYPRCRISEEQRGYNFPIREKRMPNCPIIYQLPEGHGRLVDMNDVEGMFEAAQIISEWHKVEEELPKEHMWCFVYTHDPEMIMPIRIAFYVASCTGKGSWYHYESGEDIDDEVDYWTPMYLEGPDVYWPIEPPKEDADANK